MQRQAEGRDLGMKLAFQLVYGPSKEARMKDSKAGKKFRIKCGSKYFEAKYGKHDIDPAIVIEELLDFHKENVPPSFLYIGRVLAEGKNELLDGSKTYYGKILGLGEFIHESELGEEVT